MSSSSTNGWLVTSLSVSRSLLASGLLAGTAATNFSVEQRLGAHALFGNRQRHDADVELAGQAIGDELFGQLFFDSDLGLREIASSVG